MNQQILLFTLTFFVLTGCGSSSIAANEQTPASNHEKEYGNDEQQWSPEYIIENFRNAGSTAISPDGKWIAFTVSESRTEEEKSDFLTHIHMVRSDGSRQFQLTRGDHSASNPQWSPDGRYLSFTSGRNGDGNQIWMINPKGGEAWQVTETEGTVSSYRWSNTGSHIAFTMTDPPTDEEEQRRRERRDVNVVDEDLKYAHIYVFEVEPEKEASADIRRLTEGEFHVGHFDWSPDDETIVFDHQPRPGTQYWPETSISTVPSDSGAVEQIVDLGGSDTTPLYSPDGNYLAFTSDNGDPRWPGHYYIFVMDLEDGSYRQLGETFDDEARLMEWAPDGTSIYYTELHRTSIDLFAMPVDGGAYRQITEGDGRFTGLSLTGDGTRLAAIHQDFHKAPDVIVSDVSEFQLDRLTNINEGFELTELARAEVITWESFDGLEIESPLIYPLDYEEGKTYPVILDVHGGPTGVYGESYLASSFAPLQQFAAEGYFVLRPNFRGSGGYGREFRFANVSDWGYGDLEDMKAGLDYLVERGMVDEERQGIMGWSYGGYMASFAITRTDRFRASIVGAGVTNLISMTGTSDIPGFLPDYFEAEFWENYDRYKKHSAIFHVENIGTPTLILHPEEDVRVPPTQGYELYNALKRLDVETKLVTYPRQPHGIREPKFRIDMVERQIDWMNRYLKQEESGE